MPIKEKRWRGRRQQLTLCQIQQMFVHTTNIQDSCTMPLHDVITSRPVHSKTNSTGQYNWTISMNHWKLKSKRVSGQALPSGEQTRQQNYPRRNIVKQCYVWTLLQTKRNNNNAQKHLSHLIGWWDEDFCSSSGMAPMGKVSKVIVMHSHGRQTNQRVHIIKVMKTMVSDSKIKTNFYAYSNCSSKTRDVAM